MNSSLVNIEPKSLSVAIVGFTGESGKALTKEILINDLFNRTLLIGRRKIDFEQDFYKKGVIRKKAMSFKLKNIFYFKGTNHC